MSAVHVERLPDIAKWHDVIKLQKKKWTNGVFYPLLNNVTDRHMKPFSQSATKVRLATRVMNRCIAAPIDTQVNAPHI